MENELLGNILNNIVMEKAVRDKIVMQQKQQREQEARQRREDERDQLDQFDDEETRQIMRRMRNQRMQMEEEVPRQQKEETRTIGEYREIVENEFLSYVTKLKHTVVHFFHKEFQRCQIMDKHLRILSQQFPQTQFLSINAQNSPFFVQKLGVRTLPTLCIFRDGVLKGKQMGFEGLSGDEFLTYQLAGRLAEWGAISNPKEKIKDKTLMKGGRKVGSDSEDD